MSNRDIFIFCFFICFIVFAISYSVGHHNGIVDAYYLAYDDITTKYICNPKSVNLFNITLVTNNVSTT
jgi:hypothetical protein